MSTVYPAVKGWLGTKVLVAVNIHSSHAVCMRQTKNGAKRLPVATIFIHNDDLY